MKHRPGPVSKHVGAITAFLLVVGASQTPEARPSAPTAQTARARPTLPKVFKGMTVSCPGYGRIWGSSAMGEALKELRRLGVEWAAIHPYASVRRDGSVSFSDPMETGYLLRAVEIAKAGNVDLFWKPHLAYWGSFDWRGAITFNDRASWQRFFANYRAFIVAHAAFAEAHGIALLSVGIEYEKTLHFEREWREIIKAVRAVYTGKITYSTNWDSINRVPFWDAVDLIGVQAYFPVATANGLSKSGLRAGWKPHIDALARLSKKHGKDVLFTEVGYARAENAAQQPWKPALDDRPEIIAQRKVLLEVAFEVMKDVPFVRGGFWWKWIPGRMWSDRDFSMRDPEALAALRKHWSSG